jgi:phosphopantetheinyl transferase (holo-ACP synthase)
MRGEFLDMIDPQVNLDLKGYSKIEQEYITEIRRHNTLTAERFAAKNLDLKAFSEGAKERILAGKVIAGDVVLQATEKLTRQINQNLIEYRKLFGESALIFGEIHWQQHLYDASKKLADYLNALDVAQEKASSPGLKLVEDIEALIRGSIGSGREASGATLSPEVANKLRTGNFLRPFKWKEGKLVSISPDKKSVANRLRQLDAELRGEMIRDPSKESPISELRGNLANILNRLTGDATDKTKITEPRPTITAEIEDAVGLLNMTMEKTRKEMERQGDHSYDDSIRLLQDHFNATVSELRDFNNLSKVIRSHEYNLTLRRWKRSPGRDIFQGNYSSC